MKNVVLAIDPGLNRTGVAVFDERRWHRPEPTFPIDYLELTSKREVKASFIPKVRIIEDALSYYLDRNSLTAMLGYFEFPQIFGGVKGGAAASDALSLAYMDGVLSKLVITAHMIPVTTWKGNLKKELVHARLIKRYPELACVLNPYAHDVWDAVSLGMWVQNNHIFGS